MADGFFRLIGGRSLLDQWSTDAESRRRQRELEDAADQQQTTHQESLQSWAGQTMAHLQTAVDQQVTQRAQGVLDTLGQGVQQFGATVADTLDQGAKTAADVAGGLKHGWDVATAPSSPALPAAPDQPQYEGNDGSGQQPPDNGIQGTPPAPPSVPTDIPGGFGMLPVNQLPPDATGISKPGPVEAVQAGVGRSVDEAKAGLGRMAENAPAMGAAALQGKPADALGAAAQVGLGALEVANAPFNAPGNIAAEGLKMAGAPDGVSEVAGAGLNFATQGGVEAVQGVVKGAKNLPALARRGAEVAGDLGGTASRAADDFLARLGQAGAALDEPASAITAGDGDAGRSVGDLASAAMSNPFFKPARTGGEALTDLASGTATGAAAAATTQPREGEQDPRWQDRAARFAAGASAGALLPGGIRAIHGAGGVENLLSRLDRLDAVAGDEPEIQRLRSSLEPRYAAFEPVAQRIGELETELALAAEKAGSIGAVERPPNRGAWAAGKGRPALTDDDLVQIAERSGVSPYGPQWYDTVDPAAVRIYREEVMGGRVAGEGVGRTAAEERQRPKELRRELRTLQQQYKQFEREVSQDEKRLQQLEERAGLGEVSFDPSLQPADAPGDLEMPDWAAIDAKAKGETPPATAATAPEAPVRGGRTPADWEAQARLERAAEQARPKTGPAALLGPSGEPIGSGRTLEVPGKEPTGPLVGPRGEPLPPTPLWEAERAAAARAPEPPPPPPKAEATQPRIPEPPRPPTSPPASGYPTGSEAQAALMPDAFTASVPGVERLPGRATGDAPVSTNARDVADAVARAVASVDAPAPGLQTGRKRPNLGEVAETLSSNPLSGVTSQWNNLVSGGARTVQRWAQESAGAGLTSRPDKALAESVADLMGMASALPGALKRVPGNIARGASPQAGAALGAGGLASVRVTRGENKLAGALTTGVRMNAAGDEVWRTINAAGAKARAAARGIDPSLGDEMGEQAADFASWAGGNSFVADALGKAKAWTHDPNATVAQKVTGLALSAIAPYFRMPERVMRSALQMTTDPLLMTGELVLNTGLGKLAREGNVEAKREVAGRIAVAGVTWAAAIGAYAAGTLYGIAPVDPARRKQMEAQGAKWSTWGGVSLRQLGDFGQAAGIIATALQTAEEAQRKGQSGDDVVRAGFSGAARHILTESYLSGFVNLSAAIKQDGGEQAAEKLAVQTAGRFISPVTSAVGAFDPSERDIRGTGPAALAQLPGGRFALPVKRDTMTGQPLQRSGNALTRLMGERGDVVQPGAERRADLSDQKAAALVRSLQALEASPAWKTYSEANKIAARRRVTDKINAAYAKALSSKAAAAAAAPKAQPVGVR